MLVSRSVLSRLSASCSCSPLRGRGRTVSPLGAAAAIAQTGVSAGKQAIALAVFVAIGTIGPGAPVAIYLAMGERSKRILDELRGWMAQNNTAIMAVICLLIAAKLLGDGVSGF